MSKEEGPSLENEGRTFFAYTKSFARGLFF